MTLVQALCKLATYADSRAGPNGGYPDDSKLESKSDEQSSWLHMEYIPCSSVCLIAAAAEVEGVAFECEAFTGAAGKLAGVKGGGPCWGTVKGDCALVLPKGWSSSACMLPCWQDHGYSNDDQAKGKLSLTMICFLLILTSVVLLFLFVLTMIIGIGIQTFMFCTNISNSESVGE